MDDTWVIIPLYNEERVIGDVIAEVRKAFAQVVCVDDGSTDRSAELAARAGARVVRHRPVHGYTSQINHDGTGLFAGLQSPVEMMRYHSLAVVDLPPELRAVAWSEDGAIQAIEHASWPMWGVQFHPESIASGDAGTAIIAAWLGLARAGIRSGGR